MRRVSWVLGAAVVCPPALGDFVLPSLEGKEAFVELTHSRGGPERGARVGLGLSPSEAVAIEIGIGLDEDRADLDPGETAAREREIEAELRWLPMEFGEGVVYGIELAGTWLRIAESSGSEGGEEDGTDDAEPDVEIDANGDGDGIDDSLQTSEQGARKGYDRATGFTLGLIIEYEASDRLAFDARLFQDRLHEGGTTTVSNGIGLGVGYAVFDDVVLSLEATRLRERGENTEYVVGIEYALSERIALTVEGNRQTGSPDLLTFGAQWQFF